MPGAMLALCSQHFFHDRCKADFLKNLLCLRCLQVRKESLCFVRMGTVLQNSRRIDDLSAHIS